jgi:hypothetical protein
VPGALVEVDFDSHHAPYCTYAGKRLIPCTKLLSR